MYSAVIVALDSRLRGNERNCFFAHAAFSALRKAARIRCGVAEISSISTPKAPGAPLASEPPLTTNYAIDGPAHRLLMHPFPRRVRALGG